MPRYRKKIWAGDVYECEEYFSPRVIGKSYERGAGELLTSEEQMKRNIKKARKELVRIINTNFSKGDLFITLTHAVRLTYAESRKALSNFFRRLKYWRKKRGQAELKYIAVTESESKREHHHLLVNAMDITVKELTELWGLGRVMLSLLEPGGDYTGLAIYITKENQKPHGKRWSSSRNLTEPKVKVEKMKSVKSKSRPQVPKGYKEVEWYTCFSEDTGDIQYLKAIRIGGADYGEGGKERQDEEGKP